MFLRRTRVPGNDGREYSYLRLVENTSQKGKHRQKILIDFGSEKRFPRVMQAIKKFLGPADFLRMATEHEDLARLAVVFHRLDPVAIAIIRGIVAEVEQQPGPRTEQQLMEALREQIDVELQGDVDDDAPLASARAARAVR